MTKKNQFNIRVYGLLVNKNKEVLVVDEYIKNDLITKFPGGGLEFGEGLTDCLIREFYEETGNKIKIKELFFVNENFVPSFLSKHQQIISFYYLVSASKRFKIKQQFTNNFEFEEYEETIEGFRWLFINKLKLTDFDLPIDKMVVKKLKKHY